MKEAILGGIVAIILSMIANVLTPFFQDLFKIKPIKDVLNNSNPDVLRHSSSTFSRF